MSNLNTRRITRIGNRNENNFLPREFLSTVRATVHVLRIRVSRDNSLGTLREEGS